ncbi:Lrp/AsnC family transcriptional regulator [Terasakiella pusilla]|uniref:Lrp/AsnC family transcriptional regulator n=1 Tax=Terasakiella pusilla TaxID=64973 RepID=UPI003AA97101
MDTINQKLLDLLEVNARETVSSLAAKVGLSRTSTQERLSRLESSGAIQAYTIRRGSKKKAEGVRAYFLINTTGALCHEIAPILLNWPEIKSFESISGEIDALICVECDTNDKLGDLRDRLAAFHQIKHIQTLSVLKTRIEWR